MSEQPFHSAIGGSGMYRWVPCPGSPALAYGTDDPESEYAAEGTTAHLLAAHCLRYDEEPWALVGTYFVGDDDQAVSAFLPPDGLEFDPPKNDPHWITPGMAVAVQEHLDECRRIAALSDNMPLVEEFYHLPGLHPLFAMQCDFGFPYLAEHQLYLRDYKHGVGIVVRPEENPQLLYYAVGVLEAHGFWSLIDDLDLGIVQPRGWAKHVRTWATTTDYVKRWRDETLLPAMDVCQALMGSGLTAEQLHALGQVVAGEHCRFCPARFRDCPAVGAAWDELEEMMAEMTVETEGLSQKEADKRRREAAAKVLTPDRAGRFLQLFEIAKISAKAAGSVGLGYLQANKKVPGFKLVASKTNRDWKEGAENVLAEHFGDEAYEVKLKSPAQIEELPEGEKYSQRYASKPPGQPVIAPLSDPRAPISTDPRDCFEPVKKSKK